jgi:hypothetical protein
MENESVPHPPVELLDLATGYQRSKSLFALVEFGLPTLLAHRALSLDQIARSLGIHLANSGFSSPVRVASRAPADSPPSLSRYQIS